MPRNALLSQARQLRGWSQMEVARRLDVDPTYVRRWENGLIRPSPFYRERLCALFSVTADQLGLLLEMEPSTALTAAPPSEPQRGIFDPLLPMSGGSYPPLVGRTSLLEQLKAHLRTGSSVVLTALHGLPGVGKTTLALALVADPEVQASFPDGILWAGLGTTPDIVSRLAHWGSLLGIRSEELSERTAHGWTLALRAAIGQRRMLLVLDDAWRAEDVMALRVGGLHCTYLVTTRLPVLSFLTGSEAAIAVPELIEEDALALLARFVPELVAQESETALELVRLVGGLPLALTLMGGYLTMQAATRQPRRLQAALNRLRDAEQRLQVSKPTPVLERSPSLFSSSALSLQASIAVSVDYVSPPARTALYKLAVLTAKPNSFPEEAALAVSGSPLEILDMLMDAGLLEVSGLDRYTLHQTIADYARAQCPKEDASEAKRHLGEYWLEFAEKHVSDYDALEREGQNLLAALDAVTELVMQMELVRLTIAFGPFLLLQGQYKLSEGYLRRAFLAAETLGDVGRSVQVLRLLGECSESLGDYQQAEQVYQQGLHLARGLGQVEAVSALLERLGFVAQERGDYTQAETYLEEGLHLARQTGDTVHTCGILHLLARVMLQRGNYPQAEAYAQESLTLARQSERRDLMGPPLIILAIVELDQDHQVQGEQYLQEGLSVARSLGQRAIMSQLLNNLGEMERKRGNLEQARIYLQEALMLTRQMGHRTLLSVVLENFGGVIGVQGDYQQACAYFEESVGLARAINSKRILSMALSDWGGIHLLFGSLEQARSAFQEVFALNQGAEGIQEFLGEGQYGLARLSAVQGDLAEAQRQGKASLAVFEKIGHYKAKEVHRFLQTVEMPEQHLE